MRYMPATGGPMVKENPHAVRANGPLQGAKWLFFGHLDFWRPKSKVDSRKTTHPITSNHTFWKTCETLSWRVWDNRDLGNAVVLHAIASSQGMTEWLCRKVPAILPTSFAAQKLPSVPVPSFWLLSWDVHLAEGIVFNYLWTYELSVQLEATEKVVKHVKIWK